MTQYSRLYEQYAMKIQDTYGTPAICSSGISTSGSGLYLSLVGGFDLDVNIATLGRETGSASNIHNLEVSALNRLPNVNVSAVSLPSQMYVLLKLLFQNGSLIDSRDSYRKWFFPYSYVTSGQCANTVATLVKKLNYSSSAAYRMIDAVATLLAFDFSYASYMSTKVTLLGSDIDYSYSSTGDDFTISNESPVISSNTYTRIGDSYGSTEAIDCFLSNISISNNIYPVFRNSRTPIKYVTGPFTGSFSVTIPNYNSSTNFYITDLFSKYLANNLISFNIYFGDSDVSSRNSFAITMLGCMQDITYPDKDEYSISITFDFPLSRIINVETTNGFPQILPRTSPASLYS